MLSPTLNLDEKLADIIERARAIIPCDSGGIVVYDSGTGLLAPRTYYRSTSDAPIPGLIAPGSGVIGLVAQELAPMLLNDVTTLEGYAPIDPETRSELAVPMIAEGKLLGVFYVESTHRNAYKKQHQLILETLADHAATLISVAQAEVQSERQYEQWDSYAEELVLRNEISRLATSDLPLNVLLSQVAERIAKLSGSDACAITLWDDHEHRTRRLAAYGLDLADFLSAHRRPAGAPSLTAEIVQTGQTYIINNAQASDNPLTPLITEYEARAVLAMPLIARGRTIGTTFLLNLTSDHPYAQTDADKVSSALDQISLAIDNSLLLQDMQSRLSETSALLEIAAIAASSLELADMLRQVLTLSQQILGVTCGAFLLYDRSINTLLPHPNGHFGFPADLTMMRFPVNAPGSHVAIVFTSGHPYYANNLARATQDIYTELVLKMGLKNLMLAPLRVQDEPMGVFLVGNKQGNFVRADANLLMAMGSHVAAALRNNDLLMDTRERLRETEALQRIAALTSATLDLDEMLESVVRETAELLESEGAILMMPNFALNVLKPHDRSRYGLAATMPFNPMPLDGAGHMVHVYQTGQPYISNIAPTDPALERRNIATYPLNTHNRTLGILSVINRKAGDFEDVHLDLLQAIASQLATSMENAQLFSAERRRADLMALINRISQELTATLDLQGLMRKVVNSIHELLNYETVNVVLLNENHANYTVQASISLRPGVGLEEGLTVPITQGAIGRALRTGETQVVADVSEDPDYEQLSKISITGSLLIVPLRIGSNILGAIEAATSRTNGFNKTDHMAMETLAAQVSIGVENARLWYQAQRRLHEQDIVHEIGQALTSILDYGELVNAVVERMISALETSVCLLTSYDPDTGQLMVEAEKRAAGLEADSLPSFLGQQLSSGLRSVIARAIQTRQPVTIYRDLWQMGHTIQQEYLDRLGVYAQLTLPMVVSDRVVGCVMWMEVAAPREFSVADLRLAQTLTTQAAIAIENARLFRQAQRQAREQALLRRVAVGLSTLPDVDAMFQQFLSDVQQALEIDNVLILMRQDIGGFHRVVQALPTLDPAEMILSHFAEAQTVPAILEQLEHGVSLQIKNTSLSSALLAELPHYQRNRRLNLIVTPIMRRRREMIGMIEVAIDASIRAFEPREVQLLEALANQCSIAFDNISLHQREQLQLHHLEKLQISSRNVAAQLQNEVLLNTIVREAAKIFDADAVSLLIREPGSDYYLTRAAVGLSERYIRERRDHVREFRDVFYVATVTHDDEYQQQLIRAEHLRSALIIPLIKAEQQLGLLTLYSKDTPRIFTDEERELALLFAGQAAIAMENAQLFEALEERAIELAKANRLKSEFLARVSHELRTPMNSINVFSEMLLLKNYGVLSEKQADRVERILRNGRNLLALIDDLLDISKIDAGKMDMAIQPVNLRDELMATLANLESQATSHGLYLRLDVPDDLPPIGADQRRLKQILNNLIGNAIKFTKQGGVTVQVTLGDENGVPATYTKVIDTGIGIRAEDQTIIFDEFRQVDGSTTREYGGTGLGLAITKKLVEMMAGRVWVESELGQGSTFTFTLPVARAWIKAQKR